jgi:hypothetical protein
MFVGGLELTVAGRIRDLPQVLAPTDATTV